ncbi:hypothetical protein Apa02nite_052200 [Actinoplanes palleronii]|uniref:Uncharacterized protein n=2 Tax=Actinoplanes palleronii TaxID=113570 RepID=A0ABQ4BEJ7_9ACTN|nr:hypothetical protein Apa02nite_052200 [Actinoplanes palleronii]
MVIVQVWCSAPRNASQVSGSPMASVPPQPSTAEADGEAGDDKVGDSVGGGVVAVVVPGPAGGLRVGDGETGEADGSGEVGATGDRVGVGGAGDTVDGAGAAVDDKGVTGGDGSSAYAAAGNPTAMTRPLSTAALQRLTNSPRIASTA